MLMFDINVPSILIAVLVIIATYCISKFVCQTRNKSFVFHGSTFTRPTTIPSNVFQSSVHAMKLGISATFMHTGNQRAIAKPVLVVFMKCHVTKFLSVLIATREPFQKVKLLLRKHSKQEI